MKAGSLKKRITIQRPSVVQDDLGGNTVTLATLGTYWARVSRLGGSRGLEFEKVNHSRPFNVTIRANIDVLEDDLIIYNGQTLTIQSIETDEDKDKFKFIVTGAKYKG